MVKVVRELVVGVKAVGVGTCNSNPRVKAVGVKAVVVRKFVLKKASNGSFSAPFLAAC